MSFSYEIKEALNEYDATLYKMIQFKIVNTNGRFEHRALPIIAVVSDGVNEVGSFINIISGNQKELRAYFTVDAFTGFSSSSTFNFGYGYEFENSIAGINVQAIPSLSAFFTSIPHQIADNNWLASL